MTWTTSKPTVPGWYWWRLSSSGEPGVLKISQEHIDNKNVYTFGTRILLHSEMPGEWAGPLEVPKENSKLHLNKQTGTIHKGNQDTGAYPEGADVF
jgi:hypothetical protein